MQTGPEAYVSRKGMFITGIAAWVAGIALAGAAGIYTLHHAYAQSSYDTTMAPADVTQEQAAPASVEVMPDDTVVAPRPQSGVTQMQKP
jgi:hypothetical protein